MQSITINRQPVELFKILKFEGLVESGATAKQVVAEGLVSVNGEVETRKSRKMFNGDQFSFNGESYVLEYDATATPEPVIKIEPKVVKNRPKIGD